MDETAQFRAMLEQVLKELAQLKQIVAPKRAPLTIKAFAAEVGLSRWTIARRIEHGEIRTANGRIPASELSKFMS